MFFRSLVVASVVSAVAAGSCVREYTVKEGDYCDKISAAEGVSTYQLAVINADTINEDCTNLIPGQKICLGTEGEDCTTVHTVVAGDICDAVAAAHNVNTTLLYENNPQIDPECSNIYIDEVLCVADKVIVPPPSGKPPSVPPTATLAPPAKTPTPSNENPPAPPAKTPTPSSEKPPASSDPASNLSEEELPYCDEL